MKFSIKRLSRTCAVALTFGAALLSTAAMASITKSAFGHMPDGTPISEYTLANSHGMTVQVITYGGIVRSIKVPDRSGHMGDVVLGYDNLDGYVKNVNNPYFGALVGRYANRIAKAKFSLDGHTYTLPVNNGPNCLHGGIVGFDKHVWKASVEGSRLVLTLVSPSGDQGFPGTLHVRVSYSLGNDNALRIQYLATTDKDTVVNLTNHSYFNLDGAGNPTILPTRMQLFASRYTPIDKTLIPVGKLATVSGTPLDFRHPEAIGKRIGDNNTQIKLANGYDHNWILDHAKGELGHAAHAVDPRSGRVLDVYTTEPGIQLYTGNFLNGKNIGKGGKSYPFRSAFCLEAQDFPDSPNHANFPSAELKPGQEYHQTTIYQFSAE